MAYRTCAAKLNKVQPSINIKLKVIKSRMRLKLIVKSFVRRSGSWTSYNRMCEKSSEVWIISVWSGHNHFVQILHDLLLLFQIPSSPEWVQQKKLTLEFCNCFRYSFLLGNWFLGILRFLGPRPKVELGDSSSWSCSPKFSCPSKCSPETFCLTSGKFLLYFHLVTHYLVVAPT